MSDPALTPWPGFTVAPSPHLPDGTIVWMRGSDVLGWTTKERADFLALFGFRERPKLADGCTGVKVSTADFTALMNELPPEPRP